ncbi:hypothetical protein N9L68_08230 [bacterium]|nr:hypothetical protein [bacterium]
MIPPTFFPPFAQAPMQDGTSTPRESPQCVLPAMRLQYQGGTPVRWLRHNSRGVLPPGGGRVLGPRYPPMCRLYPGAPTSTAGGRAGARERHLGNEVGPCLHPAH